MKRVRVRYAPSPTGYQHIGGIRTALFNYLFAKNCNGDFILRIEDTDQARFFDGALEDIYQTLSWLGINYDEGPNREGEFGPYFQSQRKELYKKYANKLLESGNAYKCFCDSERLKKMRKEQEKNHLSVGYDRHCRALSSKEIEELEKSGKSFVIRFKAPLDGVTSFKDGILDKVEVENKTLQDFILLKSDGFPTYHLANIVDDHLMQISHVLRSQEWIPSTPNHVLLYKAFGWEAPEFMHLPMVLGSDGHKLSKRHGATQMLEFRKSGYLPQAIINFISLLGWSYDDKREMFTLKELEKLFDINKINKAPAIFNYDKLKWFNGQYIRLLTEEELLQAVLPKFIDQGLVSNKPSSEEIDTMKKIIPLIRERMEVLNDGPGIVEFMFGELVKFKAWEKIYPKKVEPSVLLKILDNAKNILKDLDTKDKETLENKLKEIATKLEVKIGAVFMPVRIAITGTNRSPELFPVMFALGKDRVLKRIEHAIQKIKEENKI